MFRIFNLNLIETVKQEEEGLLYQLPVHFYVSRNHHFINQFHFSVSTLGLRTVFKILRQNWEALTTENYQTLFLQNHEPNIAGRDYVKIGSVNTSVLN
jgi:hypothetical protein